MYLIHFDWLYHKHKMRFTCFILNSRLLVSVSSILPLLALLPQTLLEVGQVPVAVIPGVQHILHVGCRAVQLHRLASNVRHQVGRGPHTDTPGESRADISKFYYYFWIVLTSLSPGWVRRRSCLSSSTSAGRWSPRSWPPARPWGSGAPGTCPGPPPA